MTWSQRSRRFVAKGIRRLRFERHAVRIKRPLQCRTVGNAAVVPYSFPFDMTNGAGVVASCAGQYEYVSGTGVRRYLQEFVPPPKTDHLTIHDSLPRAIFGGYLFGHFGHFLLETLSRLWVEQSHDIDESVPLLWISASETSLTPWMIDLCRRIGFERQIILVHGATGALAVDELVVPEAGLELRAWVHPLQVRRLGSTQWVPSGTQKKVWLSRVGQGVSGGGLTEEIEVEHELARRGWLIVRPEELSIDEQVDLVAGASHVAGVEGSALHTLVLLRGFGGTVDVVRRIWNPTFDLTARVEGWDQRWIDPVGGRTIKVPGLNRFSGEDIEWPLVEGIDVAATALAIDRSSRRSQRV